MPRINTTVLMSDADHFSTEQAINPYYVDEPLDIAKASEEHDAIRRALIDADIDVITVDSPQESQDGVYTANWALVRGNVAILARLPDARKIEEDYAEIVLQNLGKNVLRVPDGLKFSGQGDALACGNLLFCGQGYRSDVEAQKFAAETLGYDRIQLQTIPQTDSDGKPIINAASGWPDSFFYDLDLALSVLRAPSETRKGLIAYCPDAFTEESRTLLHNLDSVEKIEVRIEEARTAFACNLVSTGEIVVMSDHAPQLKEAIENAGFKVITPHVSELAKGGGYIRCTSLSLS